MIFTRTCLINLSALLLSLSSNLCAASPITVKFSAEVFGVSSSTDFKCQNTEWVTCNSSYGLWVGDTFAGTLTYDPTQAGTIGYVGDMVYGGSPYQLSYFVNGGVALDQGGITVGNDLPYVTPDYITVDGARSGSTYKSHIYFTWLSNLGLTDNQLPADPNAFMQNGVSQWGTLQYIPAGNVSTSYLDFYIKDWNVVLVPTTSTIWLFGFGGVILIARRFKFRMAT